ncbi:Uncharacterized protein dnl_60120 [Desulfonema limicola]|uniref:Uncharacterized protein n=1 Tax=Desulfonema limicola TaxID=45656 RepID=A0A975GEM0_9BACT|nr:Uncharacterized protein dnl_05930 [Desulfonema limicola]QTA81332.1 Uncharacterized protein dnl_36640 [Desulfonema limicola]QTA83599.1 Uncharacterized protein dnl_60120 [Desulfonema limicola]
MFVACRGFPSGLENRLKYDEMTEQPVYDDSRRFLSLR